MGVERLGAAAATGAAGGAPAGPVGMAVGAGASALASLLGQWFGGKQQGEQSQLDRDAQLRQFIAALTSQDASLAQDDLTERYGRDQAYMNTFAMDPVSQQKDIFRASAAQQLARTGAPHIGPGSPNVQNQANFGPAAATYLNPDALASAAGRFYTAAGTLSPSAPVANLGSMGFSGQAADTAQLSMSDAVEKARREREALRQRQRDALYSALLTAGDTTSRPNDLAASTVNRLGLMPPSLQAGMQRPATPGSGPGSDYFNRPNPAA